MSKQKETILACIRRVIDFFLEGLFPHRCFGCYRYQTLLCDDCFKRIPRRVPTTFFVANSPTHQKTIDSLTSATYFQVPLIGRLIHSFKYQSIKDLALPLGKLLSEAVYHTSIPLPDIITAVPLHKRRLRERGFNQSFLLAQHLTLTLHELMPFVEHLSLLEKTRHTKPQSKQQTRDARLANLEDAFALHHLYIKADLEGKTIWLVDDVTTTGATLTACAKVLKAHGAREVHGFVIAH